MGNASFVIPVIDGEVYVGRRVKEPHAGLYGAIGGKAEPYRDGNQWDKPQIIPHISEYSGKIGVVDRLLREKGLEYSLGTAVRELCEEVFSHVDYPDGFVNEDITHLFRLGVVEDVFGGEISECVFYLALVSRNDFCLLETELSSFVPIKDVQADDIYPLTQVALVGLDYLIKDSIWSVHPVFQHYVQFELEKQIPSFDNVEYYRTTIVGANMNYMSQQSFPVE
jgi:8-oxo-dGTP pyrophosphatase MutT (NUDIX family)